MKKVTIALIVLTLGIISCNKRDFKTGSNQEDLTTTTTLTTKTLPAEGFKGVSKSEKGFIVFESFEIYDAFLKVMSDLPESEWDIWESQNKFVSLRTFRKNQIGLSKTTSFENYNQDVEDDLFLTFLDQYGVVQIGNVIFKAETDLDFIWTLGANHLEKYGNLLGRQFDLNTMNIFRISLDENRSNEVWDIVLNGTVGLDESGTGGQYKTTAANSDQKHNEDHTYTIEQIDPSTGDVLSTETKTYRADMKTSKQTFLFYFSVMAEMKYMKKTGSGSWQQEVTSITMDANWNFKRNPNNTVVSNSAFTQTVTDNKNNKRAYEGGKKVKDGYINAKFTWTDVGNNATRTYSLPQNNF